MNLVQANLFEGNRDLVEVTIERIKTFAPKDRPLLVAFSGGKDSVVLLELVKMSGINYEAYYSPTSCDPPEVVQFIKDKYPDVKRLKYRIGKDGKPITMWNLIPQKLMPPTSKVRYCCDYLKENVGDYGDTVAVGVRWAESASRKKLSMVNGYKGKIMLRPLIDWDDNDIWTFIRRYNVPYCCLYDMGFNRIGCIGCPKNPKSQKKELEMYPKYRAAYIRAFDRMIERRKSLNKPCDWETGEEVMEWWLNWNLKHKNIEGQCSMF